MMWLAMRSAMVSMSFRSSLRNGPSSELRHLLPVGDFDTAYTFALHNNVGALHPCGGLKIRGLDGTILENDARLAVVRVLPAVRKDFDRSPEDFLQAEDRSGSAARPPRRGSSVPWRAPATHEGSTPTWASSFIIVLFQLPIALAIEPPLARCVRRREPSRGSRSVHAAPAQSRAPSAGGSANPNRWRTAHRAAP